MNRALLSNCIRETSRAPDTRPGIVSIAPGSAARAVAERATHRLSLRRAARRIGGRRSRVRWMGALHAKPGGLEIFFAHPVSNSVRMRYTQLNPAGRPWTRTHTEEGSMAKAKKKVAKKPAKKAAKKTAKKKKTVKKTKKAKK